MRILFLSHCLPYPPNKGDKLRAFHAIRHLSRRHEIHLLALAKQDEDLDGVPALEEYCERVEAFLLDHRLAKVRSLLELLRPRPLTLAYYRDAQLARRVRELSREVQFDAVVAYCSSMAPYAEMVEGVPRVLDMVDVDSAKWAQYVPLAPTPRRFVYALEAQRLRSYEAAAARRFDRVVVATSRELSLLRDLAPDSSAVAICNGVNLDAFHPLKLPRSPSPTLVFTGQMDYFPNVDGVVHFGRHVFPELRRRFPDLEFLVVGRAPTAAVRALEELPGVIVTGAVGDVRPFLARSWIFVAPLRIAQGIQNKVLEAMAMELPTVCSEGVMAGLADGGLQPGRDLLVASSDQAFIRAIGELIEDPELRRRLGVAARQRAPGAFSWDNNLRRLDGLLEGLRPRVAEPRLLEAGLAAPLLFLEKVSERERDALAGNLPLPGLAPWIAPAESRSRGQGADSGDLILFDEEVGGTQ